MKRASDALSNVVKEIDESEHEQSLDNNKPVAAQSRLTTAMDELAQKKTRKVEFLVDHEEVLIPDVHDRIYEDLNPESCAELIDGFRAEGKQTQAAVVRPYQDPTKPTVKYQLVAGARRHWVSKYLGWKFLIEVKEMSDREAFRFNDIENRTGKDTNDYERGVRYLAAIRDGIYANQKELASDLKLSESSVTRLLDFGRIPIEVANAYASKAELKINHVSRLAPLARNSRSREQLIKRANKIRTRRKAGEALSATQVFKMLLNEETKTNTKANKTLLEVKGKNKKPIALLKEEGGVFHATISANPDDSPEELLVKVGEALKKAMKAKKQG